MARVLQIIHHAETSLRSFGPMVWAFAASILLVVLAYGFAALRIAGF